MPKHSSETGLNECASNVVPQSSGQGQTESLPAKNPAAVALGRLGGLKGGKARAAKLSNKQRKEIAKKAALSRWRGPKDD